MQKEVFMFNENRNVFKKCHIISQDRLNDFATISMEMNSGDNGFKHLTELIVLLKKIGLTILFLNMLHQTPIFAR